MGINIRPMRMTDPFMPGDLQVFDPPPVPSGSELWGSIWRTSVTKGVGDWFVDSAMDDEYPADPSYDPDPAKVEPRYRPIWPEIEKAGSFGKARSLMRDYDSFNEDIGTIANAGVPGMLAAGTFAMVEPASLPLWFVPFGKGFQAAGAVSKAARITGIAMADITAREAVMHHIDAAREPNETAKNLFLTAGIAGTLGALTGMLGSRLPKELRDDLVDQFGRQAGREYDRTRRLYAGTRPEAIFDEIDMAHVGSGEGNQFQGWGMYMSSRESIAAWYARMLGRTEVEVAGHVSADGSYARSFLERFIRSRMGNVYTMEVRESAIVKMLNWNKKITDQSHIMQVLKANDNFGLGKIPAGITGKRLYRMLMWAEQNRSGASFGEAQKSVSLMLKDAGIKGNKYLDKPSRKAGVTDPTHNVVAFDASDIRVLRRNKKQLRKSEEVGEEAILADVVAEMSAIASGRSTAGAMAVDQEKIWDESIGMFMPQNTVGIERAMVQTPHLRMAFSPKNGLAEPAIIQRELAFTGVESEGDLLGMGLDYVPLEAVIMRAHKEQGNILFAMKQAKKKIKKEHGDRISEHEISKIVSQAAAGGDDMAVYPELIPIVHETRLWRENFAERMKAVGMFEEPNVIARANKERAIESSGTQRTKIENRLSRSQKQLAKLEEAGEKTGIRMKQKDVAKIEKELARFEEKTTKGLAKLDDDIASADQRAFNKYYGPRVYDDVAIRAKPHLWVKNVIAGYRARGSAMTDAEIKKRAMSAFYNAATESKTGEWAADFGRGVPKPAHLKRITLEVDDSYIEDFLIRDVLNDHEVMIRNLLPELVLRERGYTVSRGPNKFEVLEYTSRQKKEFQYQHQKILDATEKRVAKLKEQGNNEAAMKAEARGVKKANKMVNKHTQYLKDTAHQLMKISGVGQDSIVITGPVAEFLGEMRGYASGAHLGNSAVASLHEPITGMMVMGFTPVAKAIGAVTFPKNAPAGWNDMLRSWIIGMDMRSQQTTALARAEVEGSTLSRGWKSWGRRVVAPMMYKMNGQNLFSAGAKSGMATAHQDQLVRFAIGKQKPKVGSPEYNTQISTFSKTGINKTDLDEIKSMYDAGHVTEYEGSYFANLDDWPTALKDKTVNSMSMFSEGVIVGYGSGAIPIVLDNPVGKMFTMYRNVFFNMQGKVIIPIAQRLARGDMRTARFLTAQFGMAWLIYQGRLLGRVGYDVDKFEKEWDMMSIQDHVRATIEASGSLGLWPEILGGADNLSNGYASELLQLNPSRKQFYNRNLGLTGLSPGISWADKVVRGTVGSAVSGQPMNQSEVNGLMYALPGRTIPYLDPALDAIQSSVVEGFPKGTTREKSARQKRIEF